jgi:hypothetical protein
MRRRWIDDGGLVHDGEWVATGGVGMSEDKLQRLRSFYKNSGTGT